MENLFGNIYRGKTVLITGHTGFKGSWLACWLTQLGARVVGYALAPPTTPSHFELLQPEMVSLIGDIRDESKLSETFAKYKPEIVFHLAAQPLVRFSYDNPVETYEVNVIGTMKVFEACRKHEVRAVVNITSDKCYENREWVWGYRENDPMGGYDPYSSSKGCAEILTSSYRNSYFNLKDYGTKHSTLLASCRAGNVIGGGDWAQDRLVPDIVVSVSQNKKVQIRNPQATRPWQHVLEPLSGYLQVGQKLLEGQKSYADGWNFGPTDDASITVEEVVQEIKKHWARIQYEIQPSSKPLHESSLLKLDVSRAYSRLKWKEVWDSARTFKQTIDWYRNYYEEGAVNTEQDLNSYIADAKNNSISWAVK